MTPSWPIPTPAPPGWHIDWPALDAALPELATLADCPQDPIHHGEGDVLAHTRLVAEALVADPAWRVLPEADRRVVFAAALLHDLAKPACTRLEAGRLTSRGHARRGAIAVRGRLWQLGLPPAAREAVCGLIRHHMLPFHLLEDGAWRHRLLAAAETTRPDHLALLARADATGRLSPDRPRLLDAVALFAEAAVEAGCAAGPYPFPSAPARFRYFRSNDPRRDPAWAAWDDTRLDVVVMAGLPGAGKDHWLRTHRPDLPVISLDALRAQLGAPATGDQGPVIAAARERARTLLRPGLPFAWSATNLSRQVRAGLIDLLDAYRARLLIVHVEAPPDRLFRQNRERPAPVPEPVIRRLLDRWEPPDGTEAHQVEHVTGEEP